MKKDPNAFTKSHNSFEPAHSAQAVQPIRRRVTFKFAKS